MSRIIYIAAGTSTVDVFPATIANDGVASSTVTVRVLDSRGNPVQGLAAANIVLASTSTGNTITQPTGVTNRNGQITGSIVSTVAAAKTLSATVCGLAITDTASLTVSASVPTPDLFEDFSTYSSTANMISDPRGIYQTVEDSRTANMVLDTGVGLSPSTQAMRYDYPSGVATDYTISRSLDLPAAVTNEVWVEATVRFSSDFTINGNGQGAGAALKLLHVNQTGVAGRWGINMEGGNASVIRAEGPNDDYAALYITGTTVNSTLFDGANHTLFYHVRFGASDFHEFWVDGVYQGSATGASASSALTNVALCKNINMLSAVNMEIWWLAVSIYATDPGWT